MSPSPSAPLLRQIVSAGGREPISHEPARIFLQNMQNMHADVTEMSDYMDGELQRTTRDFLQRDLDAEANGSNNRQRRLILVYDATEPRLYCWCQAVTILLLLAIINER
jgi:nucleoid-associated protein YgaU